MRSVLFNAFAILCVVVPVLASPRLTPDLTTRDDDNNRHHPPPPPPKPSKGYYKRDSNTNDHHHPPPPPPKPSKGYYKRDSSNTDHHHPPPPPPKPSKGYYKRDGDHYPRPSPKPEPKPEPGHGHHYAKRDQESLVHASDDFSEDLCPFGMTACPITSIQGHTCSKPTSLLEWIKDGFECTDTKYDLNSCGGCGSVDPGYDCMSIPGARGVSCFKGECQIDSCQSGFRRSSDGKSCTRAI